MKAREKFQVEFRSFRIPRFTSYYVVVEIQTGKRVFKTTLLQRAYDKRDKLNIEYRDQL